MNKIQVFFVNNMVLLLLVSSIVAVYGLSFYQRQASYSQWMENSEIFVVEDVTAMTSMDAYYWLKMARELDKGTLGKGLVEPTKGYPDLVPLAINDTPGLLAQMISFGKNFTDGDYYRSGLMLIPVLAGLFVFPLFFYFNHLGFGASAILGGLIGSFSLAYYTRTSMGRLDTDLLNSFFLLALACFILPISKEKNWKSNLGLLAGAGLTMSLFVWWYQQPSFILLYLVVTVIYLFIGRVISWKQIVLLLLLCLVVSGLGPLQQIARSVQTFLNAYVSPPSAGLISWPDILGIVSEAQSRGVEVMLRRLHGFLPLVFIGFSGLAYLCLRHFRQMIPVFPMIAFGIWSIFGPNRFAMYLAPLIGVGVGVMIELLVRYVGGKFRRGPLAITVSSLSLMCILFFSTSGYTGFSTHPAPIINAKTTQALLDIKRIVPKNSAMFTTEWAHGYPLMEIGDFATYHDGSLQGGMRTTLIDLAMMSTQQQEMVSLISYLEDFGFKHLASVINQKNLSAEQMQSLVYEYPGAFNGENVYVLYLENTIWKFDAMAYFGAWDFNRKESTPFVYVELHCSPQFDNIMTCRDGTIDLAKGFMNDGSVNIPLRGAFFVNDGYVVNEHNYAHDDGYYLQVLMKGGKIYAIVVIDEQIFRTNFNQQFLLGKYDRRYFEEVYNNFPVARVLKVKRAGAASTAQ